MCIEYWLALCLLISENDTSGPVNIDVVKMLIACHKRLNGKYIEAEW